MQMTTRMGLVLQEFKNSRMGHGATDGLPACSMDLAAKSISKPGDLRRF